jgi:hypothetical protein
MYTGRHVPRRLAGKTVGLEAGIKAWMVGKEAGWHSSRHKEEVSADTRLQAKQQS